MIISISCLLFFIIVFRQNVTVESVEDFPSLISANATLAIVLDREYLGDEYSEILDSIKEYMKELAREKLKHGGVNVHYYSWSSITLKTDVMAVLMVAECKDMWKAWSNIRSERAALLAITGADCARLPRGQGAFSVPLPSKPGQELPQLALDLRTGNAMSWASAVVLHDDTLNRDMVSRVAAALTLDSENTLSPLAISVFKMKHEENESKRKEEIAKTLSNLMSAHTGERYLVIATTDVVTSVMEVAKAMGMVHPKAQWLYLISDTDYLNDNISNFADMMTEGENIAIIYNITRDEPSCRSGILCQCKELLQSFVLALDRAILEEIQVAAQVSDEEWEAIRKSKLDRSISIVNDIESHLAQNSVCNNCTTWRLRSADTWGTSFQQKNTNFSVELLQVGFWRPVDGLTMQDNMFPHIIHGFRGRKLPIVSFHNPPWSILKINETGAVTQYGGLAFDIVNELAINLNFSYYVILPSYLKEDAGNDTMDFGVELDEKDVEKKALLDKVLKIIEKEGILLSATAFTVDEFSAQRVNFTMPISVQPHAFLVSRPRALSRVLLFMSPFTSDTWLCLGFSIVLMGPALFAVHKLSPFYEEHVRKRGGLANMHNCLWYIYGALLQQGGMYLPQADSGRLIVGTWWLVVLVVVTTYCGNLVAFLTFPRQDTPITTIRELIDHVPSLTWGIKSGTFLDESLKTTDEQKHKVLYSGAMMYKMSTKPMIESIRQGKHAIFDWKINLQAIMKEAFLESDRCDFALSTEEFLEERMAIILGKNNPYLRMINEDIKRMHQVGLIQKWLAEYLPKRDRCWNVGKVAEVDNHTVNMDDMQGCFYVLFLGFTLASFVIFIEYLWRRRQYKKEMKAVKPFVN